MVAARNPLVQFLEVNFAVNGGQLIIDRLNLSVAAGETVVLLGESGCGKTTTLRLVNRLLTPTAGQVLVEGKRTTDWDPIRLRRRTGYVIQEAGLFPHFTVAENVALVPALENWDHTKTTARVHELLALVGLDPARFADRLPRELSGGQRQRVGVARARTWKPCWPRLRSQLVNLDLNGPRLADHNHMLEFLQANWSDIMAHIAQHVWLVFISIVIAAAIALPLGVLITRQRRLRAPILAVANVMQTIPSLALFGFLIPLPFIGGIGPRTAVVALAFYALLPIIRNTVTGVLGVDPNVREAAVAMGMTDRQVLFKVELPLAMSVILTGVRVAVVITIGVAIIAAEVGAGGLGEYIFRGLRLNDNRLLLAGAVPSALMALLADFGFSLIEKRFDPARPRATKGRQTSLAVAVTLVAIIAIGTYAAWRIAHRRATPQAQAGHVTVASKDFTESLLLAEMVAQMLEAQQVEVDRQFDLGGNLAHTALLGGHVDLYPEYTGTAFTEILHHQPVTDPRTVYDQVQREYATQLNLWISRPLGFENTFAILVRGADARRLNLTKASGLAEYAGRWRAGFGHDFINRQDGYPGFARTYGLQFASVNDMSLDLTYNALAAGQVDVIAGNSTDGRIAARDLIQLADDKHYFPPYEAIFVVRQEKIAATGTDLSTRPLANVMEKLAGAISTAEMRQLNYEVDGAKRDKKLVVREWLTRKGFIQ